MALNDIRTAEELAAWMKRMNLSLTSAAEQLGRKRATIARYVNGITDLPESVARHAAVIEAARSGQPFESRMVRRSPRPAIG
jgi:transcriptional regulator with XRE-family HTH domain